MTRFLHKYGAFFIWFVIIAVFLLTRNPWYTASALMSGITIGIDYDAYYQQLGMHLDPTLRFDRKSRIDNTIWIAFLAIACLTMNQWYVLLVLVVGGILHFIRHNCE